MVQGENGTVSGRWSKVQPGEITIYTRRTTEHTIWFNKAHRPTEYGPVSITVETYSDKQYVESMSRTVCVWGLVVPNLTTAGRGHTPQTIAPFKAAGANQHDKGHVMALSLGGPNINKNIILQWSQWQRNGAWRDCEKAIEKKAAEVAGRGEYLSFEANLNYIKFGGRPNRRRFSMPSDVVITTQVWKKDKNTNKLVAVELPLARHLEARQSNIDDKVAFRVLDKADRISFSSYSSATVQNRSGGKRKLSLHDYVKNGIGVNFEKDTLSEMDRNVKARMFDTGVKSALFNDQNYDSDEDSDYQPEADVSDSDG